MKKRNLLLFVSVLVVTLSTVSLTSAAPKTLVFWHYLTDRHPLLQEMAKQYETATGVKVDVQLFPGDQEVEQKMEAAIQAGTAPDVYTTNGSADPAKIAAKARWAKAGGMLNLDKYVTGDWRKNYISSLLGNISFAPGNQYAVEPGLYGLPLDAVNMQILYNKELFKKAGLNPDNPPKTWAEFIAAGKKLKAAGITPFAAGFGTWLGISLWEVYAWNIMGQDQLLSAQNNGKRFTHANWVKTFQIFADMRDAGMLAEGIATWDNPDAERLFAQGKAAMMYNGSWTFGVLRNTNPELVPITGAMLPPSAGKYPVYVQGGYGAVLAVNASSPSKDEAIKFLQWITGPEQQAKYAKESFNLPASSSVTKRVKLEGGIGEFADDSGRIIPNVGLKGRPGDVDTTIIRGIQSIVLKQKTPAQVVKECNAAWEAALLK